MPQLSKQEEHFGRQLTTKPLTRNSLWRHFKYGAFFGLLYALLSSLFLSTSSMIIKKMTYFDPWQRMLFSSMWLWVGSIPMIVFSGQSVLVTRNVWMLMIVKAAVSYITIFSSAMSFRYLPMAECATMFSTIPGMATLGARVLLKEPCGLVQSGSLALTIIGSLLAIRLPELLKENTGTLFSSNEVKGICYVVAHVVFNTGDLVMIRVLGHVHFAIHMFYMGFVGVIISACGIAAFGVEHFYCGSDLSLIMSSGFVNLVGYCFLTLALQTEAVVIAALVKSSADVVNSLIFQMAFFNDGSDIYTWCGAAVVIVPLAIEGLSKWLSQLPEEARIKCRLKFILL